MGFQGRKPVSPEWFTPEDQQDLPDGEKPMRFKARPLTGTEQIDIQTQMAIDGGASPSTWRACFKLGVIDIEECSKANGKAVRTPNAFLMLDDPEIKDYVEEVGFHVFDISFADIEEKKTS